jgi:hypothetical protein
MRVVRDCKVWVLLIPILASAPALASVVVHGQDDTTFPESAGLVSVSFSVVNTGPNLIMTGVVIDPPATLVGGDTDFDALQTLIDDGACDNKTLLVGVANACTLKLFLQVLDHDPFDTFRPVNDVGKWFVEVRVPWTDLLTGATGTAPAGINITVTDDFVPEASTQLLLGSSLVFLFIGSRKTIHRLTSTARWVTDNEREWDCDGELDV